ncbi:hypothetical protein CLOSTMETH_03207 [[Clostridium] methylpentosum DSM 5476]|uniref:Uncharacterized protein n=1 Tax=[Clostridium] methylpentosum DSM 5476 TaxID=537013 RepID=C0EHH0_9FIRM|nr:hypothetical protein CLOSTMETH_03207 [[Clostridium] methylpentosum DSM 5476]
MTRAAKFGKLDEKTKQNKPVLTLRSTKRFRVNIQMILFKGYLCIEAQTGCLRFVWLQQ